MLSPKSIGVGLAVDSAIPSAGFLWVEVDMTTYTLQLACLQPQAVMQHDSAAIQSSG